MPRNVSGIASKQFKTLLGVGGGGRDRGQRGMGAGLRQYSFLMNCLPPKL